MATDPGSIVTSLLLASILNGKYVNLSALHRIEQEYQRNGVTVHVTEITPVKDKVVCIYRETYKCLICSTVAAMAEK